MSSEQQGQCVIFTCDNCEEELRIASHDFREAWEAAKEDGWRAFMNRRDRWEHRCPECRGR